MSPAQYVWPWHLLRFYFYLTYLGYTYCAKQERTRSLPTTPAHLPRISRESPAQEIPLHTVMRITYDGWNPPREVRLLLVLLGVGVGVGVGTRRTRCASS